MGKASQRARQKARRRPPSCGAPAVPPCRELATHQVVDPVLGGALLACDDHWPDLVSLIWSEGAWVSGCPCSECIGVGVS